MALQDIRPAAVAQALRPNIWDIVALILVTGAMVLIVYGGEQTTAPLSALDVAPVSLDPSNLPLYALRTTLRMLATLLHEPRKFAQLLAFFAGFIDGILGRKGKRHERWRIPA